MCFCEEAVTGTAGASRRIKQMQVELLWLKQATNKRPMCLPPFLYLCIDIYSFNKYLVHILGLGDFNIKTDKSLLTSSLWSLS